MRMLIVGGMSMAGTGKESGKPYAMHQLFTLCNVQDFSDGKRSVQGFGQEISVCVATSELVQSLRKLPNDVFPGLFDVDQEQQNFAGKAQFVVTAARPVPKPKAIV